MTNVLLNEVELELIEAIRNVRRAYPNGYDNLLYHAQQLFDDPAQAVQNKVFSSDLTEARAQSRVNRYRLMMVYGFA